MCKHLLASDDWFRVIELVLIAGSLIFLAVQVRQQRRELHTQNRLVQGTAGQRILEIVAPFNQQNGRLPVTG